MDVKGLLKSKKFWIAVIIIIVLIIIALPIWSCACGQYPPEMAAQLGQKGSCRCWSLLETLMGKSMIY